MKKSLLTKSPTQALIAEQAAKIDSLRAALKWYQAQAARRMGEAARAGIAGVAQPTDDAVALAEEVARLQDALCFWLPSITDREDEVAERILQDVFLLVGCDGNMPEGFKTAQELGWVTLSAASGPHQSVPQAETIQWRNIRKVVRELAAFCFGSADDPQWGTAYTAIVTSLTAKDGLNVQLEPLTAAPAAPLPELTGPSEAMIQALTAARNFIEAHAEECGYGFARPANPHDFHPDGDLCCDAEIAAHKAACEAYDNGEYSPEKGSEWVAPSLRILRSPWGIGSYTFRDEQSVAIIGEIDSALAASPSPAPAQQQEPSAPTDLSKRLRDYANASWKFSNVLIDKKDLLAALDEIERYYGGMLAWKRTAEAKDRESAETAAPGASTEDSADNDERADEGWFFHPNDD